jgi:NF-X1-type zinc finger protein NFXL1
VCCWSCFCACCSVCCRACCCARCCARCCACLCAFASFEECWLGVCMPTLLLVSDAQSRLRSTWAHVLSCFISFFVCALACMDPIISG